MLLQCYLDVLLCCGGTERIWSKQINYCIQTHTSSFIPWNCFGPLGRFLSHAERSPLQRKYGNQISSSRASASAPGAGMGWGEPLTPSIPPQHHQFPLPLLLPMDTMVPGRRQGLLLISFCQMQILLGIRGVINARHGGNAPPWVSYEVFSAGQLRKQH